MPTAPEILTLKAMSLASGYGKRPTTRGSGNWSPSGGPGSLVGRTLSDQGGSYIDNTPAKTKLFNHDPAIPDNMGRQMTDASVNEGPRG